MMNRTTQTIVVILLLLLLRQCGVVDSTIPPGSGRSPSSAPTTSQPESAEVFVQRVVDGDTLLLSGRERVRLLGVDTPETKKPDTPVQPFGPEASAFTQRMVEGKTVTLVFDRERFDKYHRTLAFVFVGDVCLNEELIRAGLSPAKLQYPYRSDMKRRFSAAEAEARARHIGLWSLPQSAGSTRQMQAPSVPKHPAPSLSPATDPALRFE